MAALVDVLSRDMDVRLAVSELRDWDGDDWLCYTISDLSKGLMGAFSHRRIEQSIKKLHSLKFIDLTGTDKPKMEIRLDHDYISRLIEQQPCKREPLVPKSASRRPLPKGLRWSVLTRDNFKCLYCGRSANDGAILEVDHRLPVAEGGTNDITNLVTACDKCNSGKGKTVLVGTTNG